VEHQADEPTLAGEAGLLGILGPSGSGKTTLLSILAGHTTPAWGRILLDGEPYDSNTPSRIGFVPQDDMLYSFLSVEETLTLAARLRGVDAAQRSVRVHEALASVGLNSVAQSAVGGAGAVTGRGISGGERKRLSVATEIM